MATYTRIALKTSVGTMISGTVSDAAMNTIVNRAVREVLQDADLHSSIRRSALIPGLFNDVYDYPAPVDLKIDGIIDIKPQVKRGRFDEWRYTTAEEFDRLKQDIRLDQWGDPIRLSRGEEWLGECIFAISEEKMIKTIKISRPIESKSITIDPLCSVGNWKGFGDGINLETDFSNYVKGSASIKWAISDAGGTTAGIYNDSLNSIDISRYSTEGSIFVYVYIPITTYITNFKIRIGNSASNFYEITTTTNHGGTAFENGWNLLRFDLEDKVEVGSVTETSCTYVALYMTKNALKVSENDYRFNELVIRLGEHYDLIYYSKYGWQNNSGVYLENSTADTDYLNYDTDEIGLIEYKAAELAERSLRNHVEANNNLQLYQMKLADYKIKHPSQAKLMETTYHFTNFT